MPIVIVHTLPDLPYIRHKVLQTYNCVVAVGRVKVKVDR